MDVCCVHDGYVVFVAVVLVCAWVGGQCFRGPTLRVVSRQQAFRKLSFHPGTIPW